MKNTFINYDRYELFQTQQKVNFGCALSELATERIRSVILLFLFIIFCQGLNQNAEAAIYDLSVPWPTDTKTGKTFIKVCIVQGSSSYRVPVDNYPTDNPLLDTVVGKVRDALRSSWENFSSLRFVGWENCENLTPEQKLDYVGLYIRSGVANFSTIGVLAKGSTDVRRDDTGNCYGTNGEACGPQFAPFGNLDPCMDLRDSSYHYHYGCARQYGIHEFGHVIGFDHEMASPYAPAVCQQQKKPNFSIVDSNPRDYFNQSFYYLPFTDYDWDSIMTYGDDRCVNKTGVRFGSEETDAHDRSAVSAIYPPLAPSVDNVGVIPDKSGACPAGSQVMSFQDNEDISPNRNDRGGWIGATVSDRNTKFEFCSVDGKKFGSLPNQNYAVLKLGSVCPNNSEEFIRGFDDEDNFDIYNKNWMAGEIGQNQQFSDAKGSYTYLHFCLFRHDNLAIPTMPSFAPFGFDYGVFGKLSTVSATGFVYTDDEDTNNSNILTDASYSPVSSQLINALVDIIPLASSNTALNLSKVRDEHAPVANPDAFDANQNRLISGNVLSNDTDEDGEPLTVVSYTQPSHGNLVLRADGSFDYITRSNVPQLDSFTYRVSDGYQTSNVATVTLNLNPLASLTINLDVAPNKAITFTGIGAPFSLTNGQYKLLNPPANVQSTLRSNLPAGWYINNIACLDQKAGQWTSLDLIDITKGIIKNTARPGQDYLCTFAVRKYSSLKAFVYQDMNGNNKFNATKDLVQQNWTVTLNDGYDNTQLDEKTTDAKGEVVFTNLFANYSYRVCEVVKSGWRNVQPATDPVCYFLNDLANGERRKVSFGNANPQRFFDVDNQQLSS